MNTSCPELYQGRALAGLLVVSTVGSWELPIESLTLAVRGGWLPVIVAVPEWGVRTALGSS